VRVALVADGPGACPVMAALVHQVRALGVPGCAVEVLGTEAGADRVLELCEAVATPLHPGVALPVPSVAAVTAALDGRADVVHVCSPGPAGVIASVVARRLGLPVTASAAPAWLAEPADDRLAVALRGAAQAFYGGCARVLSPGAADDARLTRLGVGPDRLVRWSPGVDTARFSPARREPGRFGGDFVVLHADPAAGPAELELVARAACAAQARVPRLRLLCAATHAPAPCEHELALSGADPDALARAYASADLIIGGGDRARVRAAQASGVPVLALQGSAAAGAVRDGRDGLRCPADPGVLGATLAGLAASRAVRARLAGGGLAAALEHSSAASCERLGALWRPLGGAAPGALRPAA
jgi:glycosyltransferase involved in cell wall biosynthesis